MDTSGKLNGTAERLVTSSSSNNERYEPLDGQVPANSCFKMRFMVVFLVTLGCFNIYSMRACMGIALVCMVNHTAILKNKLLNDSDTGKGYQNCPVDSSNDTGQVDEDGPFVWDENLQGIILSSFFWGYLTTQVIGGFISDRWGGKWILSGSLLASSVFIMLVPLASTVNVTLVVLLRILCGVAQGVLFPALFTIMSKWYPIQERNILVPLSTLGSTIGIVVSFPVSAALCKTTFLDGWPAIFYLFGCVGILWFFIWSWIMTEYPADNFWASEEEKKYIETNIQFAKQRHQAKVPWSQIFTSVPVLALCIIEFAGSFKFFMLLTQLPTYLKVIMDFNVQQNSIISVVPYVIALVVAVLTGWWVNAMKNSRKVSISFIRKSLIFTEYSIACICLVGVPLGGCNRLEVVTLLWISTSIGGLSAGGTEMNPFDLSPNFVGTLKGILSTFSAAGGIVAPYVVGILTNTDNAQSGWNKAFYLAAGLNFCGMLVFILFGSGRMQDWNIADIQEIEPLLKHNRRSNYQSEAADRHIPSDSENEGLMRFQSSHTPVTPW